LVTEGQFRGCVLGSAIFGPLAVDGIGTRSNDDALAATGAGRSVANPLNRPTVLILAYHFYPSKEIGARRATSLARYLAEKGIRVVVISSFGAQAIELGAEILPGIIAIPVAHPKKVFLDRVVQLKRRILGRDEAEQTGANAESAEGSGVRTRSEEYRPVGAALREIYFRAVYFLDTSKRWAWHASVAATAAGRTYGARALLASGPPPSALLAGARAARVLKVPYVADFRDPWSDYLAAYFPNRTLELRLHRLLERWVTSVATAVTSTGGDLAAIMRGRYKEAASRIHVVRNGYEGHAAAGSALTGGRLSILFAGELYAGRNPFPLLAGVEWLLEQPKIDASRVDVTFMGKTDAYEGQKLEDWVRGKRCEPVVRILPNQSAAVVAIATAEATLLLNLAHQQRLSVPAKTFEQLATGREILLLCEDDCETARIVSGIGGVTQIDASDFARLTAFLLDAYNRHVTNGVLVCPSPDEVTRFSSTATNETFYAILSSIADL
jgi:hypothetical protein